MKPISTIQELKNKCIENHGYGEFFIILNGGCRSSKTIYFEADSEGFDVVHEIDFSTETITEQELSNSFIGEAIQKGAFYSYN